MKLRTFFLILMIGLSPVVARAISNTNDMRPAGTLLLPYFEVDPVANFPESSTFGINKTIFTVGNATADSVLTRVTLWSDFGIPTLSFHLYLTGFDIEEIDLKQVFDGILPQSGSAISNRGSLSNPHTIFPGCLGNNGSRLAPEVITGLRNAHSGHGSSLFSNLCTSRNHGDDLLRGFVTVDVVNQCDDSIAPTEAQYSTLLEPNNAIWGRWEFIDSANNFADASPLVHVEADEFPSGQFTFYGRYNAFNASDNREALGSTWATRFLNGGVFNAGTALRVWREPTSVPTPVSCPTTDPSFLPGDITELVAFDEQEEAVLVSNASSFFRLATQRVSIDSGDLVLPFDFGWMQLNLNSFANTVTNGDTSSLKQSFVNTVFRSAGRFSTGFDATQIAHPSHLCFNLSPPPTPAANCNNPIIGGDAPVFPGIEITKSITSTGPYTIGSTVSYQIVLTRSGPIDQQDNPGDEMFDQLDFTHPTHWLTVTGASATSGAATFDAAGATVSWNGVVDAFTPTVTITINAQVDSDAGSGNSFNRATVNFDSDGDGTNESSTTSNQVSISVSAP